MLKTGTNFIDGVPVEVERKKVRCINLRIGTDGKIHLSVPIRWATLAEGESFLRSKWKWAVDAFMQARRREHITLTEEDAARLTNLLAGLHAEWTVRLGETGVTWNIRRMKTLWGSCKWRQRRISYNLELARQPREIVEYVVVHELTHLKASNHGPAFQRLMDARLPGWRILRRRLNSRNP